MNILQISFKYLCEYVVWCFIWAVSLKPRKFFCYICLGNNQLHLTASDKFWSLGTFQLLKIIRTWSCLILGTVQSFLLGGMSLFPWQTRFVGPLLQVNSCLYSSYCFYEHKLEFLADLPELLTGTLLWEAAMCLLDTWTHCDDNTGTSCFYILRQSLVLR